MFYKYVFYYILCYQLYFTQSAKNEPRELRKPNIIVILADDMGFDDISAHGSNQIPTPNIDAMCHMGICLNRMYAAPMCTPSRSSLMTGKYESNVGMNHFVIASPQPFGLPLYEKILPEYLQEAGYNTEIIGKWHLGFHRKAYTPTKRGFKHHFGYIGPYIDYYNHSLVFTGVPMPSGYDMRLNLSVHWDTIGEYATDLFTRKAVERIKIHDTKKPLFLYLPHLAPHSGNEYEPLQAPASEINKFHYIKDKKRRIYAAMVSRLDRGIGKVIKALDEKDMLENSVILFMADNGAPVEGQHSNTGSNYPFKGQKDSPYEGAVRVAAAIWSPLLRQTQRVSNQFFHISDWLPTFAKLAGVEVPVDIDGKNIWPALSHNLASPRKEILCHFDPLNPPYKAYIKGDYKYILGTTYNGTYDRWLSKNYRSEANEEFARNYAETVLESDAGKAFLRFTKSDSSEENVTPTEIKRLRREARVDCNGFQPSVVNDDTEYCNPLKGPCLFDIVRDPCETTNLAEKRPEIVKKLEAELSRHEKSAVPPRNKPVDLRSNPAQFNNTWTWWYDELGIIENCAGSMSQIKCLIYTIIILFIINQYY